MLKYYEAFAFVHAPRKIIVDRNQGGEVIPTEILDNGETLELEISEEELTDSYKKYCIDTLIPMLERSYRLVLAGVNDETDARLTALNTSEYISKGFAAVNFDGGSHSAVDLEVLTVESMCISKMTGADYTPEDIADEVRPKFEKFRVTAAFLSGLRRGSQLAIGASKTLQEVDESFNFCKGVIEKAFKILSEGGDAAEAFE